MGNCFGTHAKAAIPVYSGTSTSNAATSSKINSSSQVDSSLEGLGSLDGSTPNSGDMSRHSSSNGGSLRAFSYSDLRAATRSFRPDSILGEGGFGIVFKGYIDEHTFMPTRPGQGMVVAIKKLKLEGLQGHREWLAEVQFLGALHHPNLVKLIGFCAEGSNRLLVYEYMSRGSLENHLFRRGHHQTIPWAIRMKVAVGAARCLAFLHAAQRQVIYRDFKASNILLDNQYNAKLSDFGLAKDGPMGDDTHVSTRVMGTQGYAAPEYLATGHLSARSDVYSFGVVLLELLTGRRALDNDRPYGERKLVEWAAPFLGEKKLVVRIIDQKLEGLYSLKGAQRVANLALWCLNEDAKSRPTMKEIVKSLEPLLNARETSKYATSDCEK